MKRIIALTLVVFGVSMSLSASADEWTKRAANPSEDPNLAMAKDGADVAATGICQNCFKNAAVPGLSKNTNPSPSSSSSSKPTPSSTTQGTQ